MTAAIPAMNIPAPQGLDLQHLRELAGDDDVDLSGGTKNPFTPDTPYPVMVVEQSIVQAQKGLSMLKITLKEIVPAGATKKPLQHNILVTIPVFSQRARENYGSEKLDTMRRMNAQTLNQLIRAAYPESFEGNVEDAGKIVMGAARGLLKSELPLKGKRFFYTLKTGKDGTKTFDSFSAKSGN